MDVMAATLGVVNMHVHVAEVIAAVLQQFSHIEFCDTQRFGVLRLVRLPPDLPDLLQWPCYVHFSMLFFSLVSHTLTSIN